MLIIHLLSAQNKSIMHANTSRSKLTLAELCEGLPVNPLPPPRTRDPSIAHAPVRTHCLTPKQQEVSESGFILILNLKQQDVTQLLLRYWLTKSNFDTDNAVTRGGGLSVVNVQFCT